MEMLKCPRCSPHTPDSYANHIQISRTIRLYLTDCLNNREGFHVAPERGFTLSAGPSHLYRILGEQSTIFSLENLRQSADISIPILRRFRWDSYAHGRILKNDRTIKLPPWWVNELCWLLNHSATRRIDLKSIRSTIQVIRNKWLFLELERIELIVIPVTVEPFRDLAGAFPINSWKKPFTSPVRRRDMSQHSCALAGAMHLIK